MKKVFVSVPMQNRSNDEIKADMNRALIFARNILNEPVQMLDTLFDYYPKHNHKENIPLKFLALSINKLAEADVAVFCKGWNKARGCRIEHLCASSYGIKILEV